MSQVLHCYGQVLIQSQFCDHCRQDSFIVNEHLNCCGRYVPLEKPAWICFDSDCTAKKRKQPSEAEKLRIVRKQRHKCFYCGRRFGIVVKHDGDRPVLLDIQFDHVIPFNWNRNNNWFVACCGPCNRHKSDKMFETVEEIREHCQSFYETKETLPDCVMPKLRKRVHKKAPTRPVLLRSVPMGCVEQIPPKSISVTAGPQRYKLVPDGPNHEVFERIELAELIASRSR